MRDIIDTSELDFGMFELTSDEIDCVSGGAVKRAAMAATLSASIGAGTFGAGWMAMGVGVAFAAAPIAVVAMGALAAYGAYEFFIE